MREQPVVRPLLFMLSGVVIWAAHFTVIYAVNALACARELVGWSVWAGIGFVPFWVGAATLLALLGLGLVLVSAWVWRRPVLPSGVAPDLSGFARYTTASLALFSAVAVIWQALPAYMMTACA